MSDKIDTFDQTPEQYRYSKLKASIHALKERLHDGIAGLQFFVDHNRSQIDNHDAQLTDLRERIVRLETQTDHLREGQRTGEHKIEKVLYKHHSSGRPGSKRSEAIETLKVVGPWILGLIAIITALVTHVTK